MFYPRQGAWMRAWFLVVVLITCASTLGQDSQPPPPAKAGGPEVRKADVPVKEVVLFSSGVGYFEHFGTVRDNGSTELNFKTAQINDILKSLVLQDVDGGKVSAVTYPSQDPVAKTLRVFMWISREIRRSRIC